jgi:AcrR family transcriptional regulator
MSPRPYRLGQRQAAIDETRARMIAAARTLLVSAEPGRFSIDAVAQQADVSRATVYYQFHSKLGLLEALFDSLGASGGLAGQADAFRLPDPLAALDSYVAVFGRFWGAERTLHRRLRGLAALDPDLETALNARQEWRRHGITTLVDRLTGLSPDTSAESAPSGQPEPAARHAPAAQQAPAGQADGAAQQVRAEVIDMIFAVTSFEAFDVLAGTQRTPESVIPLIQHLTRAAAARLGFMVPPPA